MSFWENHILYKQHIERFTRGGLSGIEFESAFSQLWRHDRDDGLGQLNSRSNGPSQLKSQRQSKDIEDILSMIFTACDVFDPNPSTRADYEYDEYGLRNFVSEIYASHEELFE